MEDLNDREIDSKERIGYEDKNENERIDTLKMYIKQYEKDLSSAVNPETKKQLMQALKEKNDEIHLANECELKFHFFFDMIHEQKDNNDKLYEFDWDVSSNLQQRLYLSKDTTKMMEVINNFIAKIYKRVNVLTDENGVQQQVKKDTPI